MEISSPSYALKLSFCIATYNRADFLGETLESLIAQATDECEIVVSDNASTDDTERVVSDCRQRFARLRYFRQGTNVGPDRNFDSVVMNAQGEFCWLMGDDDTLKPGAVAIVLAALCPELSLIYANMEMRDISLSTVHSRRWLSLKSDRLYDPGDMDRLYIELKGRVGSVSNIIIRRLVWLSREREQYYESLFIQIGVVFQKPLPGRTLVIADPLINYRGGNNRRWLCNASEVFLEKWPLVMDSLAISDSAKYQVREVVPWRNLRFLLFLRSTGYSFAEYRRWIRPRIMSGCQAILPISVAIIPRTPLRLLLLLMWYIETKIEHSLHHLKNGRIDLSRSASGV